MGSKLKTLVYASEIGDVGGQRKDVRGPRNEGCWEWGVGGQTTVQRAGSTWSLILATDDGAMHQDGMGKNSSLASTSVCCVRLWCTDDASS